MAFDPLALRAARRRMATDIEARRDRARDEQRDLYARLPAVREIDIRLRSTMAGVTAAIATGPVGVEQAIAEVREGNLALQRERAALVKAAGLPERYGEDTPACAQCGDTGVLRGGAVCACLTALCAQEQDALLAARLGDASFEAFNLKLFSDDTDPAHGISPRAFMRICRDRCKKYAAAFPDMPDLIFRGEPGLGKTFLAGCLARAVAKNGYWAVYETMITILQRFEGEKFRDDEGAAADTARYLNCDLFIVDDLGTELTTPFAQSALYQLINTRLTAGRRTVVSTNLGPAELAARYSPATVSRLEGFELMYFFGRDLRVPNR